MKTLEKIRRWTWELPQSLLGLILLPFYRKTLLKVIEYNGQKVYIYDKFPGGISLGYYILVDFNRKYSEYSDFMKNSLRMKLKDSIKHESGHGIQSKRWGPLYLPSVGLCSAIWNTLRRIFPKLRKKSYYSIWPENQADKLGGVSR